MRSIQALAAAAAIALLGSGVWSPAGAAPKDDTALGARDGAGALIHVDHRDRDRDRDRWRHRDDDDDDGHRHRDRDRDDWRDRDHRHGSWDRHRHREWGWDRGRHRGWERGRGHEWHHGKGDGRDWRWGRGRDRWDDDDWRDRKHWKKKHTRRHARHHPRYRHWVGRHVPRGGYVVLRDFDDYRLPPPRHGYFYARRDDDVFLVHEATRQIVDAFVLFNAVR